MGYKTKTGIVLLFMCLLVVLWLGDEGSLDAVFALASQARVSNAVENSRVAKAIFHLYPLTSRKSHLQEEPMQWDIFHDQGYTDGKVETAKIAGTKDQSALKVSLLSGQPYAGIHAYRDLPPNNGANTFHMHLRFYFADKKPVQALEFTMNKWMQGQRWEWALQWQAVPDGSTFQGKAETWRVWDGAHWQEIKVQQTLSSGAWHTLDLDGTIENGRVHYQSFRCDDRTVNLVAYTFAKVESPGEKLAVGVQLDGNVHQDPYAFYLDDVSLLSS